MAWIPATLVSGAHPSFERLKTGSFAVVSQSIPANPCGFARAGPESLEAPRSKGAHVMAHLSAIAFAVRQALSAQGTSIPAGHTQQIIAAALGHNNLAAYQASGEDAQLPAAGEIVFDRLRLLARAEQLGYEGETVGQALLVAMQARFPGSRVYHDLDGWLSDVQSDVELDIVNSGHVESEVAMTNGTFPKTYIELSWWDSLEAFTGDNLFEEFEGVVTVDQDRDRAYYGHEIDFSASLTIERLGQRLFGARTLEVERASLR
jgi:hypothetical protein